eukprot:TRINITY_DN64724_c0_g1_i1.p1 TRINITY_DN64724_c0_g1~~TRINITY_DN64724_c0_g1_i1.p1  ORF type:complete len:770 (-),score=118.97 TRINITY_DN64724_c0_g1_i1:243-2552(-)
MWGPYTRQVLAQGRPSFCRGCLPLSVHSRGFAKKRTRLDEYDAHEGGVRFKLWKEVSERGDGFYPMMFQDMPLGKVVETLDVAVRLDVMNPNFWRRASMAAEDFASAMSASQVSITCNAFGRVAWTQSGLVESLAGPVIKHARAFRHSDLAIIVRAMVRMKSKRPTVFAALAQAATEHSRLDSKGYLIILESFAAVSYRSEVFLQHLSKWAAGGGLRRTPEGQAIAFANAFSSLVSRTDAHLDDELLAALGQRLEDIVTKLEVPAQVSLAIAAAKLNLSHSGLVEKLEKELHTDLYKVHLNSLVPLLDSLAKLYANLESQGDSGLLGSKVRTELLTQITGRLARQLPLLRPQDACRALQALDLLGVIDPDFLSIVAQLVPVRLSAWAPKQLADLLHAYSLAGNADGFMVFSIRRALMPTLEMSVEEKDVLVTAAGLQHLDDVGVARLASDFLALRHKSGVLALLAALAIRDGAALDESCKLSIACDVAEAFPSFAEWEAAVADFSRAEKVAAQRVEEHLPRAVWEHWCHAATPTACSPDALLLAVCAFPRHAQHSEWSAALEGRVGDCSTPLLPGLWQVALTTQEEGLSAVVEGIMLDRLAGDAAAASQLPPNAAAAALRVIRRLAEERRGADVKPLVEAVKPLVSRVVVLTPGEAPDAKRLVRALQALRPLRLEPPAPLVKQLADVSGSLSSDDFVIALRLLTARSVEISKTAAPLSAMATRVMAQLKSANYAWDLQNLCHSLGLEVGEVSQTAELEAEEQENATSED